MTFYLRHNLSLNNYFLMKFQIWDIFSFATLVFRVQVEWVDSKIDIKDLETNIFSLLSHHFLKDVVLLKYIRRGTVCPSSYSIYL